MRISLLGLILLVWSASVAPCLAQAPPAEPRIWTVGLSAGLALTSGNTDTSTVNAAYDLVYNPQTKNVVKSDALFLRGKNESVLTADRLGLNVCDEYSLTTPTFVFGQILGSTSSRPGALTVGEKLSHTITATTTLPSRWSRSGKTKNFDDALPSTPLASAQQRRCRRGRSSRSNCWTPTRTCLPCRPCRRTTSRC